MPLVQDREEIIKTFFLDWVNNYCISKKLTSPNNNKYRTSALLQNVGVGKTTLFYYLTTLIPAKFTTDQLLEFIKKELPYFYNTAEAKTAVDLIVKNKILPIYIDLRQYSHLLARHQDAEVPQDINSTEKKTFGSLQVQQLIEAEFGRIILHKLFSYNYLEQYNFPSIEFGAGPANILEVLQPERVFWIFLDEFDAIFQKNV